jgi:hypothetical protein
VNLTKRNDEKTEVMIGRRGGRFEHSRVEADQNCNFIGLDELSRRERFPWKL